MNTKRNPTLDQIIREQVQAAIVILRDPDTKPSLANLCRQFLHQHYGK